MATTVVELVALTRRRVVVEPALVDPAGAAFRGQLTDRYRQKTLNTDLSTHLIYLTHLTLGSNLYHLIIYVR